MGPEDSETVNGEVGHSPSSLLDVEIQTPPKDVS